MSFDLTVHLPTERMPSPQQWQAAIAKRSFPLRMNTDFDVVSSRGWRACEYQGKPGGFEYHYSILGPEELREIEIPESLPCHIMLATHSQREELLSVVIAAAVLAEMTGGLLVDPQAGKRHEGAETVAWAKEYERTYEIPATAPRGGNSGYTPAVPRPGPGKLFLGGLFFVGMGAAILLSRPSLLMRIVAIASLAFGILGFVACVKAFLDGKKKS